MMLPNIGRAWINLAAPAGGPPVPDDVVVQAWWNRRGAGLWPAERIALFLVTVGAVIGFVRTWSVPGRNLAGLSLSKAALAIPILLCWSGWFSATSLVLERCDYGWNRCLAFVFRGRGYFTLTSVALIALTGAVVLAARRGSDSQKEH